MDNVWLNLPKDCVRWVKSETDGFTRNGFLRIRPQARGIGGGAFSTAHSRLAFLETERGEQCPAAAAKNFWPSDDSFLVTRPRLEVGRRDVAQRRVQASAVVKHFDGLEQARASLRWSFINFAMCQLLLPGREEALGRRVIPAATATTRAAFDVVSCQRALIVFAGVLHASP